MAFADFMISAAAEAQLDVQRTRFSLQQIKTQESAIAKHAAPKKLTHGQVKDFATTLFSLQLRPGVQSLASAATANPPENAFVAYMTAYYKGKFVDRMGKAADQLQISKTITDAQIAAAESVLLEFIADTLDPTPVMGSDPTVNANTTFYPGNNQSKPTALDAGMAGYVQLQKGSATACGITTDNVWVLRYLANGASDEAAAVGGLVANTPGGLSFGLGVLGKISIGDNQTLSVIAKTAASRVALRVTLAAAYAALQNVQFNIPEPGQ